MDSERDAGRPEGVALGGRPRHVGRLEMLSSTGVCLAEARRTCLESGPSVSERGLTARSGRVGLAGRTCPGLIGVFFHGVEEPELRIIDRRWAA